MFIQFPAIISIIQILSLTGVKASQEFITSGGVVYGNSLVISTIKPPKTYISTSYYTAARVGLATLSDSFATVTTEPVVVSSITGEFSSTHVSSTSSPETQNDNTISILQPFSTYSTTDYTIRSSSNSDALSGSSAFRGIAFPSLSSLKSSSHSFAGNLASTGGSSFEHTSFSRSAITATLTPHPTLSSADESSSSLSIISESISSLPDTNGQNVSPTISRSFSLGSNMKPFNTVKGSDGTCTIYYDDTDYYSTVYLTSPGQSVDAATTLTRTKTIYKTITNSFNQK